MYIAEISCGSLGGWLKSIRLPAAGRPKADYRNFIFFDCARHLPDAF